MSAVVRQLRGEEQRPMIAKDQPEPVRPYRLWNSKERVELRGRYYLNLRHAHWGALQEAAWADGLTCIEVVDIRTASLKGQYSRDKDNRIVFWRSRDKLEDS